MGTYDKFTDFGRIYTTYFVNENYLRRSAASSGPGFAAVIFRLFSPGMVVTESDVASPPSTLTLSRIAINWALASTTAPTSHAKKIRDFIINFQSGFVFQPILDAH